ncbi:MAG TPA: NADP-dependent oxidoreductase [Anaerolineales bacterium]
MTEMMSAVRVYDYGDPSVLKLEQVERPAPGAGQVLIRLQAAGVNPADWKYRSGAYKTFMPLKFPWTPGLEGAGVIAAVGEGVTSFRPGQEVYGPLLASYAEYALADAKDIQPKPRGVTLEEAATLPIGALTAWAAVVDTANVAAGQRVLVHGAAGGVGGYAVQLARWKGAHVSGTASAANIESVRSLGAEAAIDYGSTPFETVVHDFDAVIDTVGGDLILRSLKVLRRGGIYVTVTGRVPDDAGKAEGVRALGVGRAVNERLRDISELVETHQVRPTVGAVFALGQARQAHELSQTGHGRGRILLRMP